MSINLSDYDITQVDYLQDSNDDGAIPQSGAWLPLAPLLKRKNFKIGENRLKHRGNSQTLQIDQQVKTWFDFELEYLLPQYEASPLWDWWDIINKAFYGGATGAPVTRPGTIFLGVKYNRATPEYWTASGCKIEEVVIRGNMVQDAVTLSLRGRGRGYVLNTTNYVQGSATRQADPTLTPIVPASDSLIKIDNVDETNNIQSWTLTLRRAFEYRGRSAAATGSSSQIALTGKNFREFLPNIFEGRLNIELDPFGTTSGQVIDHFNDKALATCELQLQNTTNGKQIQFTASRTDDSDQPHNEGQAPSTLSLDIEGSTFNVNTL